MLRRRALLIASSLLLTALLQSVAARAEERAFKADPESRKLGVEGYEVEWTQNHLDIRALDKGGSRFATISADLAGADGIQSIAFESAAESLQLSWNTKTAALQLTDNHTGEWVSATPSLSTHQTEVDGKRELLDRHAHAIALALVAVEQNMLNLGIHPRSLRLQRKGARSSNAGQCPVPGGALSGKSSSSASPQVGGAPGCEGPIDSSAVTARTSRSLCCDEATNDVESACWNEWCVGCCRIIGCDAACLGGTDYACICTAKGQECSDPNAGGGGGGSGGGGGGGGCSNDGSGCPAECFHCNAYGTRPGSRVQ